MAAVMVYTQPLFVALAEALAGVKVPARAAGGVALGFAGVALSMASVDLDLGAAMALAGGAAWVAGTVHYARRLAGEDLVRLNAFMNLAAFPALLALTALDPRLDPTPAAIGLVILIGLPAQAAGFYLMV